MTGLSNDREKNPLMKALHEVGLAHKVTMVVVAIPMEADDPEGVRPLLIDHRDDTSTKDVRDKFEGAGVFLIKAAGAVEDYVDYVAELTQGAGIAKRQGGPSDGQA